MAVETITTVLAPPIARPVGDPHDLTDLATVHDELSLPESDTSNDVFLLRAIRQGSRAITSYCNRTFQVEAIQDEIYVQQDPYPYQVPGGVYPLQLSRWPLVNWQVVAFTGNTHGSILVDGISSTAGILAGMLVFASDGSIPAGTRIKSVASKSVILTQAATSSETALSLNTGVQVIQSWGVGLFRTLVYGRDFNIDARRGWLIRINAWTDVSELWEAVPVTVQYQAGYPQIPDDIQDACLRLVTARFRARGRDPMLVERSQPDALGTERYWIGTAPGQSGALAPEIAELVNHYRVPIAL